MNSLSCALLALALAGNPGSPAPGRAPAILCLDSLEDLKKDIAAKEGALDENAAVEFTARALKLAKTAKNAAGRADLLKLSYGLKFRDASAPLDKLRGQIWDLLIEHDANDPLVAPLVSQYLTDAERAASMTKRSKLPEVKAACAFVPLGAMLKRSDRGEKETKDLADGLRAFQKEFGQVVDPRSKKPWSDVCDDLLFQVEHLAIDCEVGEIEATDTAGVKFKLSDYRGKVVMLDFWGNW
jgi:hypothetical protein